MPATEDALQRNYVGAGGQLGRGAGSDACVVVKVQPRRRSYGEVNEAPGSDEPEDGGDKGAPLPGARRETSGGERGSSRGSPWRRK